MSSPRMMDDVAYLLLVCLWLDAHCLCTLQGWYATDGYKSKPPPKQKVKVKSPNLGTMTKSQLVNLCSRFFQWYVVDDRPGDPTYSKRESKVGV